MTDGANSNRYVVDIDRWVSSMERILKDVPQYMCRPGHQGRITRVPENLREVDYSAYEPYFLSMGPYHHGKPRLQSMENTKRVVLNCLLKQKPEITLKDYLREINSIEPAARSFYSDVEMDREQFVQMLLLDSVYIVTVFCGIAKGQGRLDHTCAREGGTLDNEGNSETMNMINEGMETEGDDEKAQTLDRVDDRNSETRRGENNVDRPRWFWTLFAHDLFLLENQLPLFVLQKIHDLVYDVSEPQLVDVMKDTIGNMLARYRRQDLEMANLPTEEAHHLLHLCHLFFRPTVQPVSTNLQIPESPLQFRLGSAMQLYEAGVSFELTSSSANYCLLDITFNSGKMFMPCLPVDDNTDSLLRNLIAFEQMKYPSFGLHVTAYVVLLLHLVTTPEDVSLLRRKGIIQHHLASDKEMMYFVNRLSVGLSFDYTEDEYSLKPLFLELKRYTELRVPRWKAWLKHRHFRNPWTVMSVLAASLLLLLSIVETYYTVYSYYYPNIHS